MTPTGNTSSDRPSIDGDSHWFAQDIQAVERAILKTVAYADVFDYPLSAAEIHRYLVGNSSSFESVDQSLRSGESVPRLLSQVGEYYTLPGRESLVKLRNQRRQAASRMWPKALHYGRTISRLPFVRMVAITGALAMENAPPGTDIDYLIVTESGRLWVCRAAVIGLVRAAALRGDVICPNYFIAEHALTLTERSLYSAHELTQAVPISGHSLYRQMRALNRWAEVYLPNADGPPRWFLPEAATNGRLKQVAEIILRLPLGDPLERREMRRIIRKYRRNGSHYPESAFCPAWCKGHLEGHGEKTIRAFQSRLQLIAEALG